MSAVEPNGWATAELSDVALIIQGQSPPGDTYNTHGAGLPFFQGKAEFGQTSPIVRKWCTAPKKVAQPGDVLISIRAPVGPTNLAEQNCCIGRGLAALRPGPGVASRYLLHFLRHTAASLRDQATGSTFDAVSGTQLGSHRVRLCPTAEQQKVVLAVESYLSRLDEAEAALDRVQRNLKRYRSAVLQAAVEGRLVPTEAELARAEARDYEPASELLKRILAERRRRWEVAELARLTGTGKPPGDERWKKQYREPAPLGKEALPDLPQGWLWVSVDTVRWDAGYGTSQKCTPEAQGPPVLRIPNVQDQRVRLENMKYATVPRDLKLHEALAPGDFVFIRTNGSQSLIGRGALVDRELPREHYFASYLIRLRLVPLEGLPHWAALVWHSDIVRRQVLTEAASSAGQYNVTLAAATRFAIPLPPMREQMRILEAFAHLSSEGEATASSVSVGHDRCTRLRQSILKWAFEGRLVDQDPNDEPASVLLELIHAERAQAEVHRPRTRRTRPRKER